MNDDELRRTYAASRRGLPPSGDAPSLEELVQLVEGTVSGDQREALLDRALADPHTTRELAMLQAVSSARPRPRAWAAARWIPLAAAAAVVLAVTPLLLRNRETEPVFRSGDPTSAAIRIAAPAAGTPLAAGVQLAWQPVPDADRYVVEVVSGRGDAIASITTRDTALTLPDSIAPGRLAGAAGWMVVAHLRDGGQRQSIMRVVNARTP